MYKKTVSPIIKTIVILLFVIFVIHLFPKRIEVFQNTPKLHVLTVVTETGNPNFRKLVQSVQFRGIQIKPLISNIPIGHGKGFGMKLKMVKDYIQRLPDTDLVIFVDGYDVLFGPDAFASSIIKRYQDINKDDKAIFSAELSCWPDSDREKEYPYTKLKYKYLNSGTYISCVKTLKILFDSAPFETDIAKMDDQRYFTNLYLSGKNLIQLDHKNQIFNCLASALDDLQYKNERWYNKETNSYPLIFHGNGASTSKDFLFNKIYPTLIA